MTKGIIDGEDLTLAELLSDGIFIDGDWVESKDQDPDGDVRLIQLADVGDGSFRNRSERFLTLQRAKKLHCTFLEPGDILVARMPDPLGRACVFPGVGQPAVTAVDVCILRPNPKRARPEWLVRQINSPMFRSSMEQFVRGTTRQRISRKNLGTLQLHVPDVDEQLSVATALEAMESRCESATRHVTAAQSAVAKLYEAALAAACSGRLTEGWRREQGALEPVEGLGDETPNDLPEHWRSATIGQIGTVKLGGTPSRKEPTYWGGNILWASSGEVANCRITTTRESITEDGLANSNAKLYPAGTVLIAMIGEGKTRGQSAILDVEAATNQNVAGILPNPKMVSAEYLWRWALAQYEVTRAVGRGGNQPALNAQKVRELRIPIPPIKEQEQIAQRIDEISGIVQNLNQRIMVSSSRLKMSPRALLALAFDKAPKGGDS